MHPVSSAFNLAKRLLAEWQSRQGSISRGETENAQSYEAGEKGNGKEAFQINETPKAAASQGNVDGTRFVGVA
jgi:hypothetical protein